MFIMLKKYIVLLLLFIGVVSSTFAQDNVSGYLGKRAFIEYNYNAPLFYLIPYQKGSHLHSINFQYVLKRRLQVGLSYDRHAFTIEDNDNFNISGDFVELYGNAIGINFDWYRRGLLAPVGMYWRLEGKYLFGEFREVDTFTSCCPVVEQLDVNRGDYNHYAISVGYGIRRIYRDLIVFNVGGSVGLVASGGGLSSTGYSTALKGVYNVRVHAGIGILLF